MKKLLKYIIVIIILFSYIITPLNLMADVFVSKPKTSQVLLHPDFNKLKLAVAEIKVGKHGGAGVILKQEGQVLYILTAKHILNKKGNIAIQIRDAKGRKIRNNNISRKDIYIDRKVDIGLVRMAIPKQKVLTTKIITVDLVKEDLPTVGQEIYTIGHPLNMHYTVNRGIISNYVKKSFQGVKHLYMMISAPSFSGNSGGAVLDVEGNLIGIVVGIMYINTNKSASKRTYLHYMTFAVYPKEIRRFLNEVEKKR